MNSVTFHDAGSIEMLHIAGQPPDTRLGAVPKQYDTITLYITYYQDISLHVLRAAMAYYWILDALEPLTMQLLPGGRFGFYIDRD